MQIRYSRIFKDSFKKLSHPDKDVVLETIRLFKSNPHDPSLANHPLRKPMIGQRAISVRDDLRITFREKGGYIEVLMLDVGGHGHVYLG